VTVITENVEVGTTQQASSVVKDETGTILTGRSTTWNSTNLGVATVIALAK
jgi:hypothetical protein